MRIIDHESIMKLNIKPYECYCWVKEMLEQKDLVVLPAKISMKQPNHVFYNIMPCIIPQENVAGVKIVNRYPSRIPSLDSQIILYDFNTGKIKAMMDGNFITAMRTGAVAALSIQLLAVENFKTIGLIGLGNTARAVFRILLDLYNDRNMEVKLYSYKDQAEIFIKEFEKHKNISFTTCPTYEEIVEDSDIVISCVTFAENNFCSNEFYKEGCLVVPIHTLGFQNCDLYFDKVYADDLNHVKDFKYFHEFKKFAEISAVIKGEAEGRENKRERIIVYNIGIAMHDIFFAEKIYKLIDTNNKEVGMNVYLRPPNQKFWL